MGSFEVVLSIENHDDATVRLGDTPTLIYADTAIAVGGDAPTGSDQLIVGRVSRSADGQLAVTQDDLLYLVPSRHGHTGKFFQDAAGRWRFDGPELTSGAGGGPTGDPVVLRADDFGCIPDGRALERVTTTADSTRVQVDDGTLRSSDEGKLISIPGAVDLATSIRALVDRKHATKSTMAVGDTTTDDGARRPTGRRVRGPL